MSHHWPSPPEPSPCLIPRPSSTPKGGTLIAADVLTLEAHAARVCDPDGYRPRACRRCGHAVLHVHDYRYRTAQRDRASGGATPIVIVRHACANAACGAIWQTLPAFLPRHLWHPWRVVEAASFGDAPAADRRDVPQRTRARWAARLGSAALALLQLFAVEIGTGLDAVAIAAGALVTRAALVATYAREHAVAAGRRLLTVAGAVHALERTARLV